MTRRKQPLAADDTLEIQIRQSRFAIPQPYREYRFHILRGWRFDFCWPTLKMAIEIQGGIWRRGGGAHTGIGHLRDMEKGNDAALDAWMVFHFTPDQVYDGTAIAFIEKRMFYNASGRKGTERASA